MKRLIISLCSAHVPVFVLLTSRSSCIIYISIINVHWIILTGLSSESSVFWNFHGTVVKVTVPNTPQAICSESHCWVIIYFDRHWDFEICSSICIKLVIGLNTNPPLRQYSIIWSDLIYVGLMESMCNFPIINNHCPWIIQNHNQLGKIKFDWGCIVHSFV